MDREVRRDEAFQKLLSRARAGSQEALAQIVNCFSPSVYRSIRKSLVKPVRQTTDSDDIAQSVWRSFFALREKSLLMGSPEQLRGFLTRMATNKTIDRGRRFFAQKRRPVSDERICSVDQLNEVAEKRVSSPSEEMIARESLENLVCDLPERFSAVIKKRAEGASISEISAELDIPLRSLHRILQNARLKIRG